MIRDDSRLDDDVDGASSRMHHEMPIQLQVSALLKLRGGADYHQLDKLAPLPSNPTYDDKCNARSNFVKFILHSRLQYVKQGKRSRDFVQWVRQNKGDPAAIITDNDDDDNSKTGLLTRAITNPAVPAEREADAIARLKHDPFDATNRLNLDLVLTSRNPDDCFDVRRYDDKSMHSIQAEDQTPSLWQLGCRALRLGLHFAPVWSTVGVALVSKKFRQAVWYPWLANSIGSSGAAWIKWGQWSSTRHDMFPEALCDQLSNLHAAAPAHSWAHSQQQVERALGLGRGTLGCVFDAFDAQPLASGSIAQVHKADLCGVPVAVKIRHPRVQQLMDMDFRLMTAAATLADKLPGLKWLHIRESVEQFSHTMAAQAYLQVEAHHLEVLNYNFRRWSRVKFPTPFFASAAVIIETFEPGVISTDIIDKYDAIAARLNNGEKGNNNGDEVSSVKVQEVDEDDEDALPEDSNSSSSSSKSMIAGHDIMPLELSKFLVSTGVSLYLKMLLVDNLCHADLHPGNIMVDCRRRRKHHFGRSDEKALALVGGSSSSQAMLSPDQEVMMAMDDVMDHIKITLVDAGMVTKLNDEESSAFIGLLSSLGEGDGAEAADWALKFSVGSSLPDKERQSFVEDMVKLFEERCRGYGTGVDVGFVLRGVLGLIRKHRVRIDANFATLVINALCVESLARRVCPSYNVLDAGRPLLQGYRQISLQKKGDPKSSKLFYPRMAANALKKEVDDRLFFLREGRRKSERQQRIAEHIRET